MESQYWLFIITITILFIIMFNMFLPNRSYDEHMLGETGNNTTQDINITVNGDSYDPYEYGCESRWCRKRSLFYGDTPFIWNNWSRYPTWNWPYYAYLYNWYYDSYGPYGYYRRH